VPVDIDVEACKGIEDCAICTFVCPVSLFVPSGVTNTRGYLVPQVHDQEKCTGCGNCMISCPDMAIVIETEEDLDAS